MKEMRKVAVMFVLFVSVAIASMSAISEKQISTQQVGIGCGYMAGETEGGASGAWTAAAGMAGAVAVTVGYGALINSWNPLGWVGGAVAGGLAL